MYCNSVWRSHILYGTGTPLLVNTIKGCPPVNPLHLNFLPSVNISITVSKYCTRVHAHPNQSGQMPITHMRLILSGKSRRMIFNLMNFDQPWQTLQIYGWTAIVLNGGSVFLLIAIQLYLDEIEEAKTHAIQMILSLFNCIDKKRPELSE